MIQIRKNKNEILKVLYGDNPECYEYNGYPKNMYFFGPCIVRGAFTSGNYTISAKNS